MHITIADVVPRGGDCSDLAEPFLGYEVKFLERLNLS